MKIYLDLETRSAADVTEVGSYRYAHDQSTRIILFAYAIDDGEVNVIEYDHVKIQKLLDNADMIVAHNSMFDRVILKAHGFKTHDHKWYDTMIQAYAHSYAGSLATLSSIFKLGEDTTKDADGKRLIKLFSVPQKEGKFFDKRTHPMDWQLFVNYAHSDITAMREVHKKLPDINFKFGSFEHQLWLLDQKINDKGVGVDVELAAKAVEMIDREAARLGVEAQELTDGDLVATTQTLKSRKFIKMQFGYDLPDLKKTTIEEFLTSNDDLPDDLVTFLENRNQSATSSASKYKTVVECNVNGRLHGTLQFCGANRTGRWSGRLFQPQNLPRPELPQIDIDLGIDLIKQGCPEVLTDNLMQLASSCIRGLIIPSKGNKLVVSDLSAIEGRTLMWLAGEQWELDAYARGEDIYKLTYGKAFGVPVDKVTKAQRQIGKVMVLALGYSGGVGAFVNFATIYGIDLGELAKQVMPTLPVRIVEKSKSTYEWICQNQGTPDMPKSTWLAIDGLKVLWRESHPKTAKLWKTTEDKVKEAIANKGKPLDINDKLRVMCSKDGTLMIKLPSGRYICYPNAHVKNNKIHFMKALGKSWIQTDTYGGRLVENLTQAAARDVLAYNMPAISEQAEILLTVHDEVITEVPIDSDFTHETLSSLLATQPSWANGLPLNAEGFEALRYRKD